MSERKLIAAFCKDKKAWSIIKDHSQDLSPESNLILVLCSEFYAADSQANFVDLDILKERIKRQVQSDKLGAVLIQILDDLPEVSAVNVAAELVELKKHKLGLQIGAALLAGRHNPDTDKLIATYQGMVGETLDLSLAEVDPVTGIDVRSLITDQFNTEKLIKVLPKALNDRLDGGMSRGHHLMLFARPEIGKSLVAINMAAGFLQQKLKVTWFENEEPNSDVLLRVGSRVSGMNKYQIRDNPEQAARLIEERVGSLFTIVGLSPGTFSQIEGLTDRYKPDVVIINQLRNIDVRSENRTQALERASLLARSLAKSRDVLVISVTQAGDSASDKRVLSMGDIDSSNTGMQGPTDVILGIGATQEDVQRGIRWMVCCKNKRAGPQSHEPFQVFVDTSLSKVVEG